MAEMESLGDKTPVSCLQEYLVSKQLFPHYELIYNGVGTHNPLFIYRVKAGEFWEEGSGTSKRKAKHKAAEKMLKKLNIINSTTEDEDSNEVPKEPAENFVGYLKEFCLIRSYPEPKYYLEEAAGPPHSRIFRMICCVSQLQDHGTSTTKKQAKQQAAWKMLQRLKELKGNMNDESSVLTEIKIEAIKAQKRSSSVSDDEVVAKYNTLRSNTLTAVNKDPAVLFKDHHKAYIGLSKTSVTLANIISGTLTIDSSNSLNLLNNIAQELEVTLAFSDAQSIYPKTSFYIVTMAVYPPIAGLGKTKEVAAFNLLDSLLFLSKE